MSRFHKTRPDAANTRNSLRARIKGAANSICIIVLVPGLFVITGAESRGLAQEQNSDSQKPIVYRMRIQMRVEGTGQTLTRISARCPIPIDWPEQKVKLLSEKLPSQGKSKEQTIQGMGAVWILECPKLPRGQFVESERIYELTRSPVITELEPKRLKRPEKLPVELRNHLQSSPGIETEDKEIKSLAVELAGSNPSPGEFVEAAASWVGKNVQFELGTYKGAKSAFQTRRGDCEEMSALLIALCRIDGIPARTVWVEGHAYPEIFLEDEAGEAHWLPVELPGSGTIGRIHETRPILQKGDQYRDPLTKQRVRYLPQQAVAFGGQAKLAVTRTILDEDAHP